jgi:hypothetical protein
MMQNPRFENFPLNNKEFSPKETLINVDWASAFGHIRSLAPNHHIVRRFNPKLNLSVFVADYSYFDIAINDDGFVLFPGEYEHPDSPSVV